MSLEWFSHTTKVWPLLGSECPEWLMQTFTSKVGFQMAPTLLWTLRMCSSPLPDHFFMISLPRRFTSFMYILGPSKDSWGALYGFLEFLSTELPFLWNVVFPQLLPVSDSLTSWVRCPCFVRTCLSALWPGVGLQANSWDSHRCTSLVSLSSGMSLALTLVQCLKTVVLCILYKLLVV